MIRTIKRNLQRNAHKLAGVASGTVVALATTATKAFAEDTPLTTAVKTSVQTAVTDTINMMMAILPIGLTVFATVWGVKKAMRFFKSTTN